MRRPLVLLHGYCGSALDFAHVRPALDRFVETIACDHRGHGDARAAGASGPINLELLAEDLIGVLDRHHLERAHVLGHSMGGKVLLRFALAHPERVASMILLGTGANAVSLGPLPERSFRTVLKDRARKLIGRDAIAQMAAALYATDDVRRRFERVCRKTKRAVHPHAVAELRHAIVHARSLVPRLKEIACPTTAMVGEHDSVFRADAEQLATEIPGARFVLFEHSSHYPHFEQEAAFVEAVRAHFDQQQIVDTKTNCAPK